MAIAMMFESPDITAEIYDAVLSDMVTNFGVPPARIFHVAGPSDDGWRVVDVWESQEEFDTFAKEQVSPLFQKHGVTSRPKISIWPVHNRIP